MTTKDPYDNANGNGDANGEAAHWVEDTNLHAMLQAQDRFTLEYGEDLKENCSRLAAEAAMRFAQLEKGTPPRAFGAFDRDEIARILSFRPVIRYDGFMLNTDSGGHGAAQGIRPVEWETDAQEAWNRNAFIGVYRKYLEAAAKFAESHGAESAMRDFRQAFELVKGTEGATLCRAIPPEDALRVIDLEQAANATLRGARTEKEAAK